MTEPSADPRKLRQQIANAIAVSIRVIDNLLTVVEADAIEEARLRMEARRNEVARRALV
ncbi:hypothetical protein [Caulobacter sp. Root655]|uniref:hypothetical protein n=1 Tax=Caulobacter sp. Root655 TaxID=1736578 RepID=UPI000A569BE3|nr:hypothetical protein [Caulobacter sp. Root655]